MPKFLFSLRVPKQLSFSDTVKKLEAGELAQRHERVRAWYESLGDNLVERSNPVSESTSLGDCGPDTRLGGYIVVGADDYEAAVALAKTSPIFEAGGGLEVGAISDLDPLSR
jgi:hypothetical protein